MILVDIYIPSVDQNYDFEIDEDMILEELVDKLSVLLSAYLNTNLKKIIMSSCCALIKKWKF